MVDVENYTQLYELIMIVLTPLNALRYSAVRSKESTTAQPLSLSLSLYIYIQLSTFPSTPHPP